MPGPVTRRTTVQDLGLELRIGEHTPGAAVAVHARWLVGPLLELDETEKAEAEAGRLKAARQFVRDHGLVLVEVTS